MKFPKQIIQAHRGASGYAYQNTIEAFDKALEMKADSIELDIRKTLDKKIIVVHDPLYNGKHINDWNYDELILETKKDKKNSDEGFVMPLFIDVLKRYKGKYIIDIEIKEEGYEQEIVDMILSVLDLNEFHIRSFSEKTIRTIKKINKKIFAILLIGAEFPKYGFLTRIAELFPLAKILRSKCDAVSPHYLLVRVCYVQRMHFLGKPVFVWTVNEEDIMRKMISKHVDGVVTNYPDIALRIQKELNGHN